MYKYFISLCIFGIILAWSLFYMSIHKKVESPEEKIASAYSYCLNQAIRKQSSFERGESSYPTIEECNLIIR